MVQVAFIFFAVFLIGAVCIRFLGHIIKGDREVVLYNACIKFKVETGLIVAVRIRGSAVISSKGIITIEIINRVCTALGAYVSLQVTVEHTDFGKPGYIIIQILFMVKCQDGAVFFLIHLLEAIVIFSIWYRWNVGQFVSKFEPSHAAFNFLMTIAQ